MVTLDLLLTLGSKLADVLTTLVNNRVTKEEKLLALTLIEQYNSLKETHLQIHSLLEQYNIAIQRMLTRGGPEEVFPFCTYLAYQHVVTLYNSMLQSQINYQQLEEFELLSINSVEQTVKETNFSSTASVSYQRVIAYTHEKWITLYQTGRQITQDVINCYSLVWSAGTWKIQQSEIYVKP